MKKGKLLSEVKLTDAEWTNMLALEGGAVDYFPTNLIQKGKRKLIGYCTGDTWTFFIFPTKDNKETDYIWNLIVNKKFTEFHKIWETRNTVEPEKEEWVEVEH